MNKEQVYGALRTVGVALMTYLVSTGKLTSDQASALANAAAQAGPVLAALGLAAYGWWRKRDAAKITDAGKVTGVQVMVDPNAAAAPVVHAALAAPDSEVKLAGMTPPPGGQP